MTGGAILFLLKVWEGGDFSQLVVRGGPNLASSSLILYMLSNVHFTTSPIPTSLPHQHTPHSLTPPPLPPQSTGDRIPDVCVPSNEGKVATLLQPPSNPPPVSMATNGPPPGLPSLTHHTSTPSPPHPPTTSQILQAYMLNQQLLLQHSLLAGLTGLPSVLPGILPNTTTGQTSFLPSTTTGQTSFLPGTATGQTSFLPGTATGQTGFLPGTATGQTSFLPGTATGQTSFLPGTATSQTGFTPGTTTGQTGLNSAQVPSVGTGLTRTTSHNIATSAPQTGQTSFEPVQPVRSVPSSRRQPSHSSHVPSVAKETGRGEGGGGRCEGRAVKGAGGESEGIQQQSRPDPNSLMWVKRYVWYVRNVEDWGGGVWSYH